MPITSSEKKTTVDPPYILTGSAAGDLRSIVNYTNDNWGRDKCLAYIAQIEAAACEVALGKGGC